jgi:hypothetical protein
MYALCSSTNLPISKTGGHSSFKNALNQRSCRILVYQLIIGILIEGVVKSRGKVFSTRGMVSRNVSGPDCS